MFPANSFFTLHDIGQILWRRKWLLVLPSVAIFIATAVYSLTLPNMYSARTVILVEGQKIPESYVESTVNVSVWARLRTITQQIKSHTRLLHVIEALQLVEDIDDERAVENQLRQLRSRISVEVISRVGDAFTISYMDANPNRVAAITNKLADLFIEENIKVREAHATGTTAFLELELERIREVLHEQEKRVSAFRRRHMGELPE